MFMRVHFFIGLKSAAVKTADMALVEAQAGGGKRTVRVFFPLYVLIDYSGSMFVLTSKEAVSYTHLTLPTILLV